MTNVFNEGTNRESGKNVQMNNIQAARIIADTVKTTLGPKGMDKMLVDSFGDVQITNDGATILREIDVAHPAAKMIIEVAKTQESECGDGTTTSVILTGELLTNAGALVNKGIHPTVINNGYNMASAKALEILISMARKVDAKDREVLLNIARTSMSSKNINSNSDIMTQIVVGAVTSVADDESNTIDLGNILIQKAQGGSMNQTELLNGIILNKERSLSAMPTKIHDAHIALFNTDVQVKTTSTDSHYQINSSEQMQQVIAHEKTLIETQVSQIIASGANVIITSKTVDDVAQHLLAKKGIVTFERVRMSDIEKLCKATGASILNSVEDLDQESVGFAGKVEEKRMGDDIFTYIMDCPNPKAVTILLRGGTKHVLDEAERALDDALNVVKVALEDGYITPGGGAAAIEISMQLKKYATTVGGREQMAVEAFADALEIVPKTLAQNAGLDEIDALIALRKVHADGNSSFGLNLETGQTVDMFELNVIEPLRVGTQEIKAATEAAVMILRIDDMIAARNPELDNL